MVERDSLRRLLSLRISCHYYVHYTLTKKPTMLVTHYTILFFYIALLYRLRTSISIVLFFPLQARKVEMENHYCKKTITTDYILYILILRHIIERLLQFHSTHSSVPCVCPPRVLFFRENNSRFAEEREREKDRAPKCTYIHCTMCTETENKQLLSSNWLTRYYATSQRKAINRFRLVNHISAPTFRVRHSQSIFVVHTYTQRTYMRARALARTPYLKVRDRISKRITWREH